MVRAGVVSHPSKWPFSGYNEIQKPRRKNVLMDYDRLQALFGTDSYDQAKEKPQGVGSGAITSCGEEAPR